MIEGDDDLQALAAQQRQATLKKVGIAVVVVLAAVAYVVPTGGAVTSMLEEDGHTQVEVTRKGVFDFSFTSRKGASNCQGSVTKMPGSMRSQHSCFGTAGDTSDSTGE